MNLQKTEQYINNKIKSHTMKKRLLIDRDKFFEWYFDHDTATDFFYTHNVKSSLASFGKFNIKATELLDSCGYIPQQVVEDGQDVILDEQGDVDTEQYSSIKFSTNK